MFFKVFVNKNTDEELFAYDLHGEGGDEEYYTKILLADENGIGVEDISVRLERRAGVPCATVIRLKNGEITTTHYVHMDGAYYCMKCENKLYAGHYEAWEFRNDCAAINVAIKNKAVLTKEEWRDNKRVSCVLLYEPYESAKK